MKILITTPFFDNLGGSELETIHTANAFASFTEVKAIDLFVYGRIDLTFLHNIFIDPKIKFIKMPVFFNILTHDISSSICTTIIYNNTFPIKVCLC